MEKILYPESLTAKNWSKKKPTLAPSTGIGELLKGLEKAYNKIDWTQFSFLKVALEDVEKEEEDQLALYKKSIKPFIAEAKEIAKAGATWVKKFKEDKEKKALALTEALVEDLESFIEKLTGVKQAIKNDAEAAVKRHLKELAKLLIAPTERGLEQLEVFIQGADTFTTEPSAAGLARLTTREYGVPVYLSILEWWDEHIKDSPYLTKGIYVGSASKLAPPSIQSYTKTQSRKECEENLSRFLTEANVTDQTPQNERLKQTMQHFAPDIRVILPALASANKVRTHLTELKNRLNEAL